MTRLQASRRGTYSFGGKNETTSRERPPGFNSPLIWIAVIVAFLIGYMVFSRDQRAPPPGPSDATAPVSPPKIQKIQEIQRENKPGSEARAIVASARKEGGKLNLTRIYTEAGLFFKNKKLTDAYLLYFFAAREGHSPSAFVLGKMADPQYHSSDTSPFDEPDPVQALKWYQMASQGGVAEAKQHLLKLRKRIETAAREGDPKARQLMLGWR